MTCEPAWPVAPGDNEALNESGAGAPVWALVSVPGRGALGHHHERRCTPGLELLAELGRDRVDVVGNLGNQHSIGAHRHAGLQRQPACLFSQHFNDTDFACRVRGLADSVQGIDGEDSTRC